MLLMTGCSGEFIKCTPRSAFADMNKVRGQSFFVIVAPRSATETDRPTRHRRDDRADGRWFGGDRCTLFELCGKNKTFEDSWFKKNTSSACTI